MEKGPGWARVSRLRAPSLVGPRDSASPVIRAIGWAHLLLNTAPGQRQGRGAREKEEGPGTCSTSFSSEARSSFSVFLRNPAPSLGILQQLPVDSPVHLASCRTCPPHTPRPHLCISCGPCLSRLSVSAGREQLLVSTVPQRVPGDLGRGRGGGGCSSPFSSQNFLGRGFPFLILSCVRH